MISASGTRSRSVCTMAPTEAASFLAGMTIDTLGWVMVVSLWLRHGFVEFDQLSQSLDLVTLAPALHARNAGAGLGDLQVGPGLRDIVSLQGPQHGLLQEGNPGTQFDGALQERHRRCAVAGELGAAGVQY